MSRHLTQAIYIDENDTARFRGNAIVQTLLDCGPLDMNNLAALGHFSDEDRTQFAQLIGYSVGGFGELSYVDDDSYDQACEIMGDLLSSGNHE